MKEPVVALVVAAGSGRRLGDSVTGGSDVKALRRLAGRPLVLWSVEAMVAGGANSVVVVVPAGREAEVRDVLHSVAVPVEVVAGGAERQDSVRHGLAAVAPEARVVLVHDAARPLVPSAVTRRVIDAVRAGADAVVPAVPVTDTIRRLTGDGSVAVERAELRAVQTPQGFTPDVLRRAHEQAAGQARTDDAGVCEAAGVAVTIVDGSPRALKITHPSDFAAAAALLEEH